MDLARGECSFICNYLGMVVAQDAVWGLEVCDGVCRGSAFPKADLARSAWAPASVEEGAARSPKQSASQAEQSKTAGAPTACAGAAEGTAPSRSSPPSALGWPSSPGRRVPKRFPASARSPHPRPPRCRCLCCCAPRSSTGRARAEGAGDSRSRRDYFLFKLSQRLELVQQGPAFPPGVGPARGQGSHLQLSSPSPQVGELGGVRGGGGRRGSKNPGQHSAILPAQPLPLPHVLQARSQTGLWVTVSVQ